MKKGGGGDKRIGIAFVLIVIWAYILMTADEFVLENAIPFLQGGLRFTDFPFPWW